MPTTQAWIIASYSKVSQNYLRVQKSLMTSRSQNDHLYTTNVYWVKLIKHCLHVQKFYF